MFTTREQATFILLGVLLVFILAKADIRKSTVRVIRNLVSPKIGGPIAAYLVWVGFFVWIASVLRVWTTDLVGATLLWLIFTGFALFLNLTKAGEDEHYFRKAIVETLTVTALFEFFNNIHTFNIFVEVLLQLGLIIVVSARVVALLRTNTWPYDVY